MPSSLSDEMLEFLKIYFSLPSDSNANANGIVTGENSNMTGNAFINANSANSNGNAEIDAQGGGKGPSSALTSGNLELTDADNNKRSMLPYPLN